MPETRSQRKRRIADVKAEGDKRQDIELTGFKKYTKLPSELRNHILAYNNGSTLLEYSACSKYCNTEVQKFNTTPPQHLVIKQRGDIYVLVLWYKTGFIKTTYKILPAFTMEIGQYLMKCYKYVKQGKTSKIRVELKHWPTELMELELIANIENWDLMIQKLMLKDCIDYFTDNNVPVRKLTLKSCWVRYNPPYTLQPQFFKSRFFKSVSHVRVKMDYNMDREDFLSSQQESLYLTGFELSDEDIRAKVEQWNNMVHLVDRKIVFYSFDYTDSLADIFDDDDEVEIIIDEDEWETYKIGKVWAKINGGEH